jgi:hypothetical protein
MQAEDGGRNGGKGKGMGMEAEVEGEGEDELLKDGVTGGGERERG